MFDLLGSFGGILVGAAIRFVLLLPSIVFHEVAHGYVAYLLGDDTAKRAKRLTLNPLRHIDPWGTIIMPALLLLASGGNFAFGYAKPVPVNPYNFKDRRQGMLLTAIAGPVSNLLLAAVAAGIIRLADFMGLGAFGLGWLWSGIAIFAYFNLLLMVFNLVPLPPLDGSRVVARFLSGRAERFWHDLERYGFVILLAIVWLLPDLTGIDPIGALIDFSVEPLYRLLLGG